MKIYKLTKLIFVIALGLFSHQTMAQYNLTGSGSVPAGNHAFYFLGTSGGGGGGGGLEGEEGIQSVSWSAGSHGTVVTSDESEAYIHWTVAGSATVTATIVDDNGTHYATKLVTVTLPVPTTPTISSNFCGNKTLTRGSPPSGITWYWQTSASGTSTSSSSTTYTVSSSGTYYLRARTTSGSTWSASSASVTVTVNAIPPVPPLPSIANNCGNTTLTKGSAPSGITWYWQSEEDGEDVSDETNTSAAAPSRTFTSNTTHYLRAQNDLTGCWSAARIISVTVATTPAPPTGITKTQNCGNTVLTFGATPSDVSFFWQSSSGAVSTSEADPSITLYSGDTYYLRAKSDVSNCWSTAYTVTYTIDEIPDQPSTVTVTENCGTTILARNEPPSDVTWYWQSSANGMSTTNDSSAINRTTESMYYLRGRNNDSGCWGPARSVPYAVKVIPDMPPMPSSSKVCGITTLTAADPPTGFSYFWQNSPNGTSLTTFTKSLYRDSGTVYYLRSRNDSTNCWSEARIVNYTVDYVPNTPPEPSASVSCGTTTLTRADPPSGFTYFWQTSANGTNTNSFLENLEKTSETALFLRSRNNSTLCWSDARTVDYSILAKPTTPTEPDVTIVYNCGSTTLVKGDAPSGVTWYWQSSPGGTDVSDETNTSAAAPTRTFTSGTEHYLRARNDANDCWSGALKVEFSIFEVPVTPSGVIVTQNCGSTKLTYGAVPDGVTWYWQTNPYGVEISESDNNFIVSTGSVYYLRAKNNITNCWSAGYETVEYSVKPATAQPPVPEIVQNCGSTRLISSGPPENNTYFWQSYAGGTEKTDSLLEKTLTSGSKAYLRAYNASTDCWSIAKTVDYTINQIPGPPSPPSANAGEYSTIFTRITPPSGVTWYWQGTNPNGMATDNTSYTFTATSTGTYYLRSRADNGCWGPSVAVSAVVCDPFDPGNHNYVMSTAVLVPGITQQAQIDALDINGRSVSVNYFDGLGRPLQSVGVQASPDKSHIVQALVYDQFGRQLKQYLPYVINSCNVFQPDPIGEVSGNYTTSDQYTFYQNEPDVAHDVAPYAQAIAENSPLNRLIKQGSPGTSWQPVPGAFTDHVVRQAYETNTDHQVRFLEIASEQPVAASTNGYYNEGELISTVTSDEDGNEAVEFTNKRGQVVLKQVSTGNTDNLWANTYYVYDDFGNLRIVLPPELSRILDDELIAVVPKDFVLVTQNLVVTTANHIPGKSYMYVPGVTVTLAPGFTLSPGEQIRPYIAQVSTDLLDTWAFQYKYDGLNRMSEKKVPGAGWVYLLYDFLDRVMSIQDATQRSEEGGITASFTKYDVLGRVILTGTLTNALVFPSAEANQAALNGVLTEISESLTSSSNNILGYTRNVIPTNNDVNIYETATYYDDYGNLPSDFSFTFVSELGNTTYNTVVKGQVVGGQTKLLDGSNTWLKSITYYDDRYRVIQTQSENLLGGIDRVSFRYDFAGRVLETKTTHDDGSQANDITIAETFTYDHASRLMETTHQVGTDPDVILVKNEYNELGELMDKKLHSADVGVSFEQSIDYDYNIRGWLNGINNVKLDDGEGDYFGMRLNYNKATGTGNVPTYNGNISGAKWSNYQAGNTQRDAYNYSYDAMNRLTEAEYRQKVPGTSWVNKTDFDLPGISYDLNGNILNLTRNHKAGTALDDLTYSYDGNQLLAVSDAGDISEGFKDGNTSGDDYTYDANGNMISDANKDILSITYNHLNLPEVVTFTGDRSITYTYDAVGIKLKKQVSRQEQQTVTNYNIIETSDSSSDLDGWTAYQGLGQANQDHSGETDVLKMIANTTNNLHRFQKAVAFPTGEQIRIRAKVYLPSTNTKADGIQIQAGFSSSVRSQTYTTTDTWLSIDYTTESVPNAGFMFFLMKDGSSDTFLGTINDYFFIKDIEISNATGTSTQNVEVVTTTDYVGGFIYEDNVLQQIAHSEGRVRRKDTGDFIYDYYLKDHLGNTRVTFTTENEQVVYLATMETDVTSEIDYQAYEESLFLNLPATRTSTPGIANNSGEPGITNDETARLRGNDPSRQTGPAKLMQVSRGDVIDLEAYAYYTGTYTDNGSVNSGAFISAIISAVTGAAPVGTETSAISGGINSNSAIVFVGDDGTNTQPRAYLNYILFDRDFNYIDAGFDQVSSTAKDGHEQLSLPSLNIDQGGYLYVYVSNESNNSQDVYFDDLRITHTKSKVLQEDHYYPFGLTINALSSSAPLSKPNRFKYNGNEEQTDFNLNLYDFNARMYDANLGRFNSVDPLADATVQLHLSPYQFSWNNPINLSDPTGQCPLGINCNGIEQWFQRKVDRVNAKVDQVKRDINEVRQNIADEVKKLPKITTEVSSSIGIGIGFKSGNLASADLTIVETEFYKETATLEKGKLEGSRRILAYELKGSEEGWKDVGVPIKILAFDGKLAGFGYGRGRKFTVDSDWEDSYTTKYTKASAGYNNWGSDVTTESTAGGEPVSKAETSWSIGAKFFLGFEVKFSIELDEGEQKNN